MRGILNQEILLGIRNKLSPTKIKNILKTKYNVSISKEAFKTRYDTIKARL